MAEVIPEKVTVGENVVADGSASYDPDGTIVAYEWKEGSTVLSRDESFIKSDFNVGIHDITLTVTDNDGDTGTDAAKVIVEENNVGNIPPIAAAGPDQTIGICDALVMDGTGSSDEDGNIVSHVWSVNDGQIVLGEGPTPTLTMSGRTPGEHNITLTVTDNDGATASDTVTVTVNGADEDYDFSYIIYEPSDPAAQTYIATSNAELRYETYVEYWKPVIGAATEAETAPGIIDLHFNFPANVEIAYLATGVFTFHWDYSEGHAFLRASKDGAGWEQLAEALPPAYSEYNYAGYNDFISPSLIGSQDLYIRAELYSYGSSASSGGVLTNTAQFLRHQYDRNTQTFKLNVCYEGSVPLSCENDTDCEEGQFCSDGTCEWEN